MVTDQNPVYNTLPTTPPGLAGLPYVVGGVVAPMVGSHVMPYVPPTQSTYDAMTASRITNPLYKEMLQNINGQYGAQLGGTVAGLSMIPSLAKMLDRSPDQLRYDLINGGAAFGRSAIGSLAIPFLDSALSSAGLSGGSFIGAATTAFNNRFGLIAPTALLDPLNGRQQVQAMASASAFSNLVNGMISKSNNGVLSIMPDNAVTQGFDRTQVMQIATMMTNGGAFTSKGAGIGDQLQKLIGDGVPVSMLDYSSGDFTGGGVKSMLGKDAASKVKELTEGIKDKLSGGIQAVGALRDMLKTTDGLLEKLTMLTNGSWYRSGSGAYAARDSIRTLNAVAQTYNIDPTAAVNMLIGNRVNMQDAAGFDESMRTMGFSGGGMYGLKAQTAIISNIEDMITARGFRGDPVMSSRLRQQGAQFMAMSQNSGSGRMAQLLAYSRQIGAISDEEADQYQADLQSGDRSIMDSSINKLLVRSFGSETRGRRMMNDLTFVNSMRMNMNDDAGLYAAKTIMRGADMEWMRRENLTAARDRYQFSRDAISSAGMSIKLTDDDAWSAVSAITDKISARDASMGAAFKEQVLALTNSGVSVKDALNRIKSSYKANAATSQFGEDIDLAYNESVATRNEERISALGLDSMQATDLVNALSKSRAATGRQVADIKKLIRDGKGTEALAEANKIIGVLPEDTRKMYSATQEAAKRKYQSVVDTISEKREAAEMIASASTSKFGSQAILEAQNMITTAAREYKKTGNIYDLEEAFDKSQYASIFGDSLAARAMEGIKGGNADAYINRMGRVSLQLQQLAARNLKFTGLGLHYTGLFGYGKYAGNSAAREAEVSAQIEKAAAGFQDSSIRDGETRNTLAQDLINVLGGAADPKSILRIYDKSGKGESAFSSYISAFEKANASRKEYEELLSSSGYSDIMRRLSKEGNGKAVSALRAMSKDLSAYATDDDIDAAVFGLGIKSKDDVEAIQSVLKAKRKMDLDQAASVEELTKSAKNEDTAAVIRGIKNEQRAATQRKGHYGTTKTWLDSLDAENLTGTNKALYDEISKLVSDDEVTAINNQASYANVGKQTAYETRIGRLYSMANEGDARAMNLMEKAKVAYNNREMKLVGKISVEDGKYQYPATLSGSIGGLSE